MKNCLAKTVLVALAISVLSLFGCKTIVTDVNAEMEAIYPDADLGIPVNYNENYIEVAYNPSAAPSEDTEDQVKEDDKSVENTETVSEIIKDEEEDVLTTYEDETDSEDEEDIAEEDGEETDGEETDGEDADSEDGNDSDTEDNEENDESDLNASMAEDNFDAEFYARTYPDVVAVFGDSAEALYKHYQDYGKAEGRSCNEEEFALLNEAIN